MADGNWAALLEAGLIAPVEALRLASLQAEAGAPPAAAAGGGRPARGSAGGLPGKGARDPAAERAAEQARRIEAVLAELDSLVGLGSVKRMVREIRAFVHVQQQRTRAGLLRQQTALHMAFTGHPGTGKTTVARLIGRLFKEMEVLPKGHLIEVERADLVGEYIGHTAQRTRDLVRRALGGVLFIDEAYSLARGGEKDFGRECIDCLVRAMEEHRDELVVILAGYPDEMNHLVDQNPGLRSRIAVWIHFPDYSPAELIEISRRMLQRWQYRLMPEAAAYLAERIRCGDLNLGGAAGGNARGMRNLLEKALRCQAVRLVESPAASETDLMAVTRSDLEAAFSLLRAEDGNRFSILA